MSSISGGPDVVHDVVHADDEEMPRLRVTRRALVLGGVFIVLALGFLYFVLPQIAGLDETWERIHQGDPWWLALAFLFTCLSFAGYVVLFHYVFEEAGPRIDVKASYQITMAGLAATRVFAAGGAGGLALTAWALRRSGMSTRAVADLTIVFIVLPYTMYAGALLVFGLGLFFGLLEGPGPFAITIIPAIFAAICFVIAGLLALVPTDFERRLHAFADRRHRPRLAALGRRLATVPAAVSGGMRHALRHIAQGNWSLLGAFAFWAFNIAVLWASFRAFGESPPWAVIVMAYFVGMLGNLLPLPGGVGGVDGGMIGAFAAFGVNIGLATVAVLTYRVFAFWLPTIPGAIAYFQLRRTVQRWSREPAPA